MIVSREPGFILFQFEGKDWKYDLYEFLEELKQLIPKEDREYDADNQTWHISEKYADDFYSLKREFFTDKNQISLEI